MVVIGRVDAAVCRKGCAQGVIKKGRRRRAVGTVQQYARRACGAGLAANQGFERLRTPPLIIGAAINMYFNGESYRTWPRRSACSAARSPARPP